MVGEAIQETERTTTSGWIESKSGVANIMELDIPLAAQCGIVSLCMVVVIQ